MTKVAVILSGCGVFDGSEIHEAVLTLLALDRAGCEVTCAAPNVPQMHVIDHLKGQPTGEERNVLVESARIARGRIKDLCGLRATEFDAVVLPGGFGAAKNLCDFATGAPGYRVEPETERFLRAMHAAQKPIGALCIAPAVLARLLGKDHVALTIGNDAATAARISATGARHVDCRIDEICVDEQNRVVTTPCYMFDARISEIAAGAQQLVDALLRLLR